MVDNTLALNVKPVQFAENFTAGYNNGLNQQAAQREQEAAAFEQLAQIGFGVMDGNLDGPIDPQRLDLAAQMLGDSPLAGKIKEDPEFLRVVTKGSLKVLQAAQDAEKFELEKKRFEAELAAAQSGGTPTANMREYEYAKENGYGGTFEQWVKDGGGASEAGETFAMQPTYYRITDPATGQPSVKFVQFGNRGTFKETALPEGAEPAIPVQQLNTETGFTPVTKFGDKPANAEVTPIDNQGAARDTAIGKGEGERQVELPEKRRKAEGALNALKRQQRVVGEDVDKAIKSANDMGLFTTGFLGDLSKAVAGTPAYDLSQTLLTIQAGIGFDKLQEMRANSPTGGALGAISEKENLLLQAVNGATAQGQSKEQFTANLARIKTLMDEVVEERRAAFEQDFGGASSSDDAPDEVTDWTDIDWDN